MARENKYSVSDLKRDFPNDEACVRLIFDTLHKDTCSCGGRFSHMNGYRKFQCSKCRFKISPTARTIFDHSSTPLTLWFHAIFVFSNAKSGISAKEMERQLGVTYKCSYRILSLIRKALEQSTDKLSGDVEMDTAYFGGKGNAGKDNIFLKDVMRKKAVVMGAVERKGSVRLRVVPDATAQTHGEFLFKSIEKEGTQLMTDKTNRLNNVPVELNRHVIDHGRKEFVRGEVHTNTMDGFWSHIKRSIRGTYKVISKKHLQYYLDAFVFHYNNRYNDRERFSVLLGMILHGAR